MENEVTRAQAEKFIETYKECSREGSSLHCEDCPYSKSNEYSCLAAYYYNGIDLEFDRMIYGE